MTIETATLSVQCRNIYLIETPEQQLSISTSDFDSCLVNLYWYPTATSPEKNLYDRFFTEKYTCHLEVCSFSGIFVLWSTIHEPLNTSALNTRLIVFGGFYSMDVYL